MTIRSQTAKPSVEIAPAPRPPREGSGGIVSANADLQPENGHVRKNSSFKCRNFQVRFGYFSELFGLIINFFIACGMWKQLGLANLSS